MSYPSAPRVYQIDVVNHVSRAYSAVLGEAQLVGEMALLPYLVVLAAELVTMLIPADGLFVHTLEALLQALAFLVFGAVFIVRWHRFVLLGESVSDGLIPPGWAEFLVAGIKLGASVVACTIALSAVALLWDPLESTCRHASLSIL